MMYDFRDVHATTQEQQIRAWAIEQAMEIRQDAVAIDVQATIDAADEIAKYVTSGVESKGDFFDDGTLDKVHRALRLDELTDGPTRLMTDDEATWAITRMQNAGILFREMGHTDGD